MKKKKHDAHILYNPKKDYWYYYVVGKDGIKTIVEGFKTHIEAKEHLNKNRKDYTIVWR